MFRNVTARLLATLTCVSVVQPLRFHEIHLGSNPFATRLVLALRRLKPVLSPFSNSFNLRFFSKPSCDCHSYNESHSCSLHRLPTKVFTVRGARQCSARQSSRSATRVGVLRGGLLGPRRAAALCAPATQPRARRRSSAATLQFLNKLRASAVFLPSARDGSAAAA